MRNVAFIGEPKWVSPFNDNEVYLTPKVDKSMGNEYNYIIVCCSPSMNGLYRVPVDNYKHYSRGRNKKSYCFYVPMSDCEFIKPLEDIELQNIRDGVIKAQKDGFNGTQPKKVPEGFLNK